MKFREQDNQHNRGHDEPVDGAPSGGNLNESREIGDEALNSAEAAIERALSGDSLQYNRASQQVGGE